MLFFCSCLFVMWQYRRVISSLRNAALGADLRVSSKRANISTEQGIVARGDTSLSPSLLLPHLLCVSCFPLFNAAKHPCAYRCRGGARLPAPSAGPSSSSLPFLGTWVTSLQDMKVWALKVSHVKWLAKYSWNGELTLQKKMLSLDPQKNEKSLKTSVNVYGLRIINT